MLISKRPDQAYRPNFMLVMEHKNVEFMEEFRKNCSVSFLEKVISRYRSFFPGLEFLA